MKQGACLNEPLLVADALYKVLVGADSEAKLLSQDTVFGSIMMMPPRKFVRAWHQQTMAAFNSLLGLPQGIDGLHIKVICGFVKGDEVPQDASQNKRQPSCNCISAS